MDATKHVGIYTRLSVDRDDEATSTARQEADARKLADARGWTIVDVYTDRNLSGYTGVHRPEWERLLADLEADRLDGVVVWKLDRTSRNRNDWHRLATLVDRGKEFASVTDPVDTSTPMGGVLLDFLASMARAESANTSARVRRALKDRAEAGQPHHGGVRSYGYTDGWEPVPAEQEAIRSAASRLLSGDSLDTVATWLTGQGYRTVQGYEWRGRNLGRMMRAPYVAGIRVHHDDQYAGTWEPALDPVTWQRLQANLAARSGNGGGGRRVALLTGVVVCGKCGTNMNQHVSARGLRRYRCARGSGGCGSCGIAADPADQHVRDVVITALDGPGLASAVRRHTSRQPGTVDLGADLEAAEQRMNQLAADHYADGVLSRAEFLAARNKLSERIAGLRRKLASDQSTATLSALSGLDLPGWWDGVSTDRRRALLVAVLDRVVVSPPLRAGPGVDLSRLEFVWRV